MTAIRFAVLMAFAMVPALLPCMAFAEEEYSGSVYEDQAEYQDTAEYDDTGEAYIWENSENASAWNADAAEQTDPAGNVYMQDVTDPEYIEYIRNMTDLEYIEYMRNVTDPEYIEYIRNMTDSEYVEYMQNLTDPADIDNPVITEEGEVPACSEEMLNAEETDELNDVSESEEAEIEVPEVMAETDDPEVAVETDDPTGTEELSETEAAEDAEGDGIQPDIEEAAEAEEVEDPEFVTESDDPADAGELSDTEEYEDSEGNEIRVSVEESGEATEFEDLEGAGESGETAESEDAPEADILEEDMSEIEGVIDLGNTGESGQEIPLTPSVKMDPADSVAVESTEKPPQTEPAPTVLAEESGSEPSTPEETVPDVSRPIILEIPGLLMEADNFSDLTAGLANLVKERRAARGYWTLIDLVAMLFTSLISLLMIGLWIISSQADKYDENKGDTDNSLFITLLSLIPATSQIIIFTLTQDLSQQMHLTDRYTGPVLLFLAAEVFIAGIICWKERAADQKRMSY